MATITTYPFFRHLRSAQTSHIEHVRAGTTRHSGSGASFWFRPLTSAVSEVPVDDREQALMLHVRTQDLQEVAVPATVTYRITAPAVAAAHVDFSIDLLTGQWNERPLELMASVIHGAAGAVASSRLGSASLAAALTVDLGALGEQIAVDLREDARLRTIGIEVIAVRVSLIRPEPEVERALQTPAREQIQQEADKATFERRALAVEREAAIGENELANEIALAERRSQLIAQQGANARRQAEEEAASAAIAAEAEAHRQVAVATAGAESTRLLGQAQAEAEQAKVGAYADVSREVLLTLALRELAGNLPDIDQLVITPDVLSGALARLGVGTSR